MKNLDSNTIVSRLADFLSKYSYQYKKGHTYDTFEARGRYLGYLEALYDSGVIKFSQYANLTGLYLSVEVLPLAAYKTVPECAELINRVLGN